MKLPGVLLVVFVVLKLTRTVGWSWWWVLSPLWGAFLYYLVVALVDPGTRTRR